MSIVRTRHYVLPSGFEGSVVEMSLSEWMSVMDNPRQRDTEQRAVKAQRYLRTPSPEHPVVHAARLPDGTLVKLDGHTRSYLWSTGKIPPPERIICVLVNAASIDQACELYWHYDSRRTVKSTADMLSGVLGEHHFHIETKWLQKAVVNAVRIIESVSDSEIVTKQCLPLWFEEVRVVDSVADLVPKTCRLAGLVAGLMVRANPTLLSGFLEDLRNGGTCIAGNGDGPYLLRSLIERKRLLGQMAGHSNQEIIARATVKSIDLWHKGEYGKFLRADDWRNFVKRYRKYATSQKKQDAEQL